MLTVNRKESWINSTVNLYTNSVPFITVRVQFYFFIHCGFFIYASICCSNFYPVEILGHSSKLSEHTYMNMLNCGTGMPV